MKKNLTILAISTLISLLLLIIASMFFTSVPAGVLQSPQSRNETHEFSYNVIESGNPVEYVFRFRYIDVSDSLTERALLRDCDRDILRIIATIDVQAIADPLTQLSVIQDSIINATLQSDLVLTDLVISRAPLNHK